MGLFILPHEGSPVTGHGITTHDHALSLFAGLDFFVNGLPVFRA